MYIIQITQEMCDIDITFNMRNRGDPSQSEPL